MADLRVEIVQALADGARIVSVAVPQGAKVRDALAACGLSHAGAVGIFGRRVALDAPLADGDRVELYRPLTLDPKEARRRRARKR